VADGSLAEARSPHWRELAMVAGIDEQALRALARRRRYARSEVLFHEGDHGGAIHLLERGRAVVRVSTPHGDVVTVNMLQAGDVFGEQAIIDESGERTATVLALEPVETLSLDAAAFDVLRADHPEVDRFLLVIMNDRLRWTTTRLMEALVVPAEERLLRCVCRLASMFDAGDGVEVPLPQHELASMTGITRSTANRILRRAELDGLIAMRRSHVTILDEVRLRRRAGLRSR
jgi:CRP/FNR family transcriptional regulator, cyclic AMP receptor protein